MLLFLVLVMERNIVASLMMLLSAARSNPLCVATVVFCDNVNAIYMVSNPVHIAASTISKLTSLHPENDVSWSDAGSSCVIA